MKLKGVIIEESLTDISILKELEIVQTEVLEVTEREETPWLEKWTMHIVEIPSSKIENICKKLSELIDVSHCSDWYCDFKNDEVHYVVFSKKVFRLDRRNKQDYEAMEKYAVSLGLPKEQLPTYLDLPTNLLIGFLLDAKKQTYANSEVKKESASRLGSDDYHYEEMVEGEKMIYHDTYFGGTKFMGQEVVYRGGHIPKWGMVYYGITLDETLSEEAMDKALRPALMKVGEDRSVLPVRGPSHYEQDGFTYTFQSEGTMECFSGEERIYQEGRLIYQLHCQGGLIEK